MKIYIFLAVLLILVAGCSQKQENETISKITGIQELVLSEQEVQQLGMTSDKDCEIETYETSPSSTLAQYGVCFYTMTNDDTEVVIEYKKFTNQNDLNGAYQYESSHLRSSEGILEENTYGDQSKFYVNNENDYGAEFNPPGVFFYSLYFTKDEFLVHVTTKGMNEETKEDVANIGAVILTKYE